MTMIMIHTCLLYYRVWWWWRWWLVSKWAVFSWHFSTI